MTGIHIGWVFRVQQQNQSHSVYMNHAVNVEASPPERPGIQFNLIILIFPEPFSHPVPFVAKMLLHSPGSFTTDHLSRALWSDSDSNHESERKVREVRPASGWRGLASELLGLGPTAHASSRLLGKSIQLHPAVSHLPPAPNNPPLPRKPPHVVPTDSTISTGSASALGSSAGPISGGNTQGAPSFAGSSARSSVGTGSSRGRRLWLRWLRLFPGAPTRRCRAFGRPSTFRVPYKQSIPLASLTSTGCSWFLTLSDAKHV